MNHLAIDLGTTNRISWAVQFDADYPKHRKMLRFKTTREELRRVVKEQGIRCCIIESCRPAHWVHQELCLLGVDCLVANTNTEAFALGGKRRSKTDRDDALRLMNLFIQGDLSCLTLISDGARARKQLISLREQQVNHRSGLRCAIRNLLDTVALTLPCGKSGWTKATLKRLQSWCTSAPEGVPSGPWQTVLHSLLVIHEEHEHLIKSLTKQVHQIYEADDYAQVLKKEVPGVGDLISSAVSASIDDPQRFSNAKQVSKYSGFHPVPYESGKMKRTQGISRASWSTLRGYLVEACCIGIFNLKDPWYVLQYERILSKVGIKKKALCAVARKLYVKCWQIMRTGETWASVTRDALSNARDPATARDPAG